MAINIPIDKPMSLPLDSITTDTAKDLKNQLNIVDISELLKPKDTLNNNVIEYKNDNMDVHTGSFSLDKVVQALFSLDQNLKVSAKSVRGVANTNQYQRDLVSKDEINSGRKSSDKGRVNSHIDSTGFDKSLEKSSGAEKAITEMKWMAEHQVSLIRATIKFKKWMGHFDIINSISKAFVNTLDKFLKM